MSNAVEGFKPDQIIAELKNHPNIASGLTYVFTELRNLTTEAAGLGDQVRTVSTEGLTKLHAFLANPKPVVEALLHGTKAKDVDDEGISKTSQNPGSGGGNVYGSELGDNGKGLPGTSGGAPSDPADKGSTDKTSPTSSGGIGGSPADKTGGASSPGPAGTDKNSPKAAANTGVEGDPGGNDGASTGSQAALKTGGTKSAPEDASQTDGVSKSPEGKISDSGAADAAARSGQSVGAQSFGQDAPAGMSPAAKIDAAKSADNEAKKDGTAV